MKSDKYWSWVKKIQHTCITGVPEEEIQMEQNTKKYDLRKLHRKFF